MPGGRGGKLSGGCIDLGVWRTQGRHHVVHESDRRPATARLPGSNGAAISVPRRVKTKWPERAQRPSDAFSISTRGSPEASERTAIFALRAARPETTVASRPGRFRRRL